MTMKMRSFGPLEWWHYYSEHSPHAHLRLRFWRVEFNVEAWSNRHAVHTSRLCWRVQMHYDRKHGEGFSRRDSALNPKHGL